MRRSPVTRFFVIPLTLLALFSGCYKWSIPSQSPVDFIRDKEPSQVRLYLRDGRQVIVHDPEVANGDISGLVNDTLSTVRSDEVAWVQYRKASGFGIAAMVIGLGLLALVVTCQATNCFDFGLGDSGDDG